MSKNLATLQEAFQNFILKGQYGIHDSVLSTESVSLETRLAIYRDAYSLRLIESLNTSYPAMHAYLGTEAFETLCRDYIRDHPSPYRSIRWYGDLLPQFSKNYYTKDYAFLAELAEFEWKMTLAFDAADAPVLQVADMAAVAPESWGELRFTPHASLQRQHCFWNVLPLWQALVHDQELPQISSHTRVTPYIIWRSPDYLVRFYSLSEEEAWALDAILQGSTFGAVCEGLCQWVDPEEVGMQAASYLKNWIEQGMLVALLHP